jgi:hypothetical protein
VRPGDGDHAQALGVAGVGEADQPDIRPGGGDLEYRGDAGVDGGDLLGPGGPRALLILGVDVGRIADLTTSISVTGQAVRADVSVVSSYGSYRTTMPLDRAAPSAAPGPTAWMQPL